MLPSYYVFPISANVLVCLITLLNAIELGEDIRFNVELIKHNPCPYNPSTSKWNRSLEFESGDSKRGPQLRSQPGKPGCFIIGGRVNVTRKFKGDFSVYIELRTSANRRQPAEPCINQRPDGCGGFGSCLYCDACNTLGSTIGVSAQLLNNGRTMDCATGLAPGIYDNIELAFCLPPVEEILKTQGLNRESFLSIVQSEDGRSIRTMGIFVTVYIFNTDVSKLMQTQSKVIAIYRKNKKTLFKDEPLPNEVYWSLPFNAMIKNERLFVACHIIHGNVQINAD